MIHKVQIYVHKLITYVLNFIYMEVVYTHGDYVVDLPCLIL